MSANTSISWTQHTFNPWSGCAKVSAGCTNCYAANLPPAMRRHAIWGEGGERIPASESYWRQPLTWDRAAAKLGERHRVFCASVADFGEERDDLDPWRDRTMATVRSTPSLDWLVLTKRTAHLAKYLSRYDLAEYPNLWIGTSVEDQRAANERIPHLLKIPARVRFLSMEPLLGPVNLESYLSDDSDEVCDGPFHRATAEDVHMARGIQWVIVGGESGHKARPMHPHWAGSLRDQCASYGVPFHFKQWGEWTPEISGIDLNDADDKNAIHRFGDDEIVVRVGKHNAGRILDGRTWDQLPETKS